MTAGPASKPPLDEAGLPAGYPFKPEFEITPRAVQGCRVSGDSRLVLIDCRTRAEWDAARIEGAVLIPLDELPARVEEIEELAGEEEAVVAVHCHHGGRSLKAAIFLRQRGIDAKSMAGGIDLWSIDIDPSVPRY